MLSGDWGEAAVEWGWGRKGSLKAVNEIPDDSFWRPVPVTHLAVPSRSNAPAYDFVTVW